MNTYEEIIKAMHSYYLEFGKDKGSDYDYGYLDALGVLKELHSKGVLK